MYLLWCLSFCISPYKEIRGAGTLMFWIYHLLEFLNLQIIKILSTFFMLTPKYGILLSLKKCFVVLFLSYF